jgi:hypothetical protein
MHKAEQRPQLVKEQKVRKAVLLGSPGKLWELSQRVHKL